MTDIHGLLTDDDAVSPVIGVVLMVAVTVILSAAVGAFVLDIGSSVTQQPPQAVFQFESEYPASGDNTVTITHQGGDALDPSKLKITVAGTPAWEAGSNQNDFGDDGGWGSEITSGDSLTIDDSGTSATINQGDAIQIVWEDGQRSNIIGSGTA